MPAKRIAERGEIWFVQMPTDPPDKARRPVIVVSSNSRNRHERATTVLVVPLSTSIHNPAPTHTILEPGETGLRERCSAQAENITTVRKESLNEPIQRLRTLSNTRICEIADKVKIAMACLVG